MHPISTAPAPGESAAVEVPPSFRWSDLASPERDWLQRRTEDVTTLSYRVACDLVRLGKILKEVRERLPSGQFVQWLIAETPFSTSHAYRLLSVAEAFGGYISQIEKIEPSALYLLSQPNVPAQVRVHAARLASDGTCVTRSLASEIIAANKSQPDLSREEVNEHSANMRDIRDAEAKDREEAKKEASKEDESPQKRAERHQEIGEQLELLMKECTVLHISRLEDEDYEEDIYTISCLRSDLSPGEKDDRPRHVVRRTLSGAIKSARGFEDEKWCPACKAWHPAGQFGVVRTNADGRNRYCKSCERARVKVAKKKARKKRAKMKKAGQLPANSADAKTSDAHQVA